MLAASTATAMEAAKHVDTTGDGRPDTTYTAGMVALQEEAAQLQTTRLAQAQQMRTC